MVHTKLSTSNTSSSSSPSADKRSFDEQCNTPDFQRSRQFAKIDSTSKMIVHNFLANIFIKEVNLVLYNDCKDHLFQKNHITSLYLDEFIISYVEEVQIEMISKKSNCFVYHLLKFNCVYFLLQKRSLEFGFENIQIDNDLYSTGKYDFPVILCGQNDAKVNRRTAKASEMTEQTRSQPSNNTERPSTASSSSSSSSKTTSTPTSFPLPLMRDQLYENHIGHFKIVFEETAFSAREIICNIQPLRVYIEDKFIAELLDFAIENLPSNVVYVSDPNERVELNADEVVIPKIISEQILSFFSEPLRLDRLCIKPLSILLSVHTCIR